MTLSPTRRLAPGARARCIMIAGLLTLSGAVTAAETATEADPDAVRQITWDDLLPAGWVPPSVSVDHFFDVSPAQPVAGGEVPVVAELDGQRVRLPGYLVPITQDGDKLEEFLMVPYFGACIHVPPPPPNQVVFVRLANPVAVEDPYGPHWVTGVLSAALSTTELAEAAYTMEGQLVEVFDWDAMFPDQATSEPD